MSKWVSSLFNKWIRILNETTGPFHFRIAWAFLTARPWCDHPFFSLGAIWHDLNRLSDKIPMPTSHHRSLQFTRSVTKLECSTMLDWNYFEFAWPHFSGGSEFAKGACLSNFGTHSIYVVNFGCSLKCVSEFETPSCRQEGRVGLLSTVTANGTNCHGQYQHLDERCFSHSGPAVRNHQLYYDPTKPVDPTIQVFIRLWLP